MAAVDGRPRHRSARAAAQRRDPPARGRRGSPRRPGTPRSLVAGDHAALHPCLRRPAARGARPGSPQGLRSRATGQPPSGLSRSGVVATSPERVDVVGPRRRPPHRAPVQAGGDSAARMPGDQLADRTARVDELADPHRRASPVRSWCADRRDGRWRPAVGRPARRRRPRSPTPPHTPSDPTFRRGRRRGVHGSTWATARRSRASPPVAAAAASPAGRRRHGPEPQEQAATTATSARNLIGPVQRTPGSAGRASGRVVDASRHCAQRRCRFAPVDDGRSMHVNGVNSVPQLASAG